MLTPLFKKHLSYNLFLFPFFAFCAIFRVWELEHRNPRDETVRVGIFIQCLRHNLKMTKNVLNNAWKSMNNAIKHVGTCYKRVS